MSAQAPAAWDVIGTETERSVSPHSHWRINAADTVEDRPAGPDRPGDHPRRLRRVGDRRRRVGVRLGTAGGRGVDTDDPPGTGAWRELDRHRGRLWFRPLRDCGRKGPGGRDGTTVCLHEGVARAWTRWHGGAQPEARLDPGRGRGQPAAPRCGRDRPLPDPLAQPAGGHRAGLVGPRRAEGAGPCAPHRGFQLRRRPATADPADRAGRDAAAAVLADRARRPGQDSAVRRARGHRGDRLLPDELGPTDRCDDPGAHPGPARGRLAQAQRELPGAAALATPGAGQAAQEGRRPDGHDAWGGSGRRGVAQSRGGRRDHRPAPARAGRLDPLRSWPRAQRRGRGRDRKQEPKPTGGSDTMSTLGFVGLGAMGASIAGRLLSQGHTVYGTNRTRSKAEPLIEAGLLWRDSPREVAHAADVVFSMVTDDGALEALTSGPGGILAGLGAGTVYVDMSTVGPQFSRELGERVNSRGASMLAAPVSGSVPAAQSGTLAIIVGGDGDAFERVEPILAGLGSTVTFVGGNDQALLLKLAINISLAVQMLAFSEGVLLAERGGIEPALALEVLTHSAIGSPMLQARAPMLLELPEQAWFDVAMMRKDLHLALAAARELGVPVPSTAVADELLSTASKLGYDHRDIAVLFRVLSEKTSPPCTAQPGHDTP